MADGDDIAVRPVERAHVGALAALAIKPGQIGLVSANALTLAEAAYEPAASVFGIWNGTTPVGLIAMRDAAKYPLDPEYQMPRDAAYVWRLMISADHQRRGIGSAAMSFAREQAIAWGYRKISLTVVDAEGSAAAFYERFGFVETGRVLYGDEREMLCHLADQAEHHQAERHQAEHHQAEYRPVTRPR